MRKPILAAIVSMILLLLPVIILAALHAGFGFDSLSIGYLAISPILIWWRVQLKPLRGFGVALGILGYVTAIIIALVASLAADPNISLLVTFGVGASMLVLSQVETSPHLNYLTLSLVYFGIDRLVSVMNWTGGTESVLMLMVGVLIYITGYYITGNDENLGLILRISGLAGPFLGALLGRITDPQTPLALAAFTGGNGLIWIEAWFLQSARLLELAGAITIVTTDLTLLFNGIGELQFYALPWSVYFIWIVGRLKEGSTARATFLGLALATLVFPLALESTGSNGLAYGMELIFVGFVMAILGSAEFSVQTVWWGWGTAFIAGLYTLPKFILPQNNIPTIAGLLGLAIFSIAVLLRLNRVSESSE